MPDQEEGGFQVVDRRRVGREPQADAADAEPGRAAAPEEPSVAQESTASAETDLEDDDEYVEEEGGPSVPTSAVDLVQMCLGMMNEVAWVKMGFVPDPMTGAIGSDLTQARLAIDCAGDLAHRLQPHVDAKTHRDLEVLVQNLKMNFVRKSTSE